jgi:homoserine/homoserine lactone efflux protein
MEDIVLLALFAAAALNAVVPGPGMILAISRSAAVGSSAGLWITLGMLLATLILMLVTWAVLFGVFSLSVVLFDYFEVAGLVLLAVIAVLLLRAGPVPLTTAPSFAQPSVQRGLGDLAGGLATGLSSPVHLLFLLAILPQFVDIGRIEAADVVLVTLGILSITAVPMIGVSLLAAGAGRLVPRCHHWISRVGGLAILGFAATIATGLE